VVANASSPNRQLQRSLRSAASSVPIRGNTGQAKRPSPFPAWLLLTGILLIPSSLAIHLSGEGFKFTPGRAAIALLVVPALSKLLRGGRHFVSSDLFVFLTCAWMIGSRFEDDGLNESSVAEVIELMGGYIVARAYFFDRLTLQDFMRVFKILIVIVIFLACLEPLAGRSVVNAFTSGLFGTQVFGTQDRYGIVRAQSTIEDAELYGTLCCVAGSLFLYMEPTGRRRLMWSGFCFFGCLLSISSGPLGAFAIAVASYAYDRMLKRFSWRWKVYVATIAGLIAAVYLISKNPTDWLITHLTLDPATGYFRVYVFDYAFDQIAIYPLKGWGFGAIGSDEFLSKTTVDSVWLVCALRFGLPMMFCLLLANIATFFRSAPRIKRTEKSSYLNDAGTAFTFAISCFMGIGITVHYWNAIWMFWAVCLGIRASIKESQLYVTSPSKDQTWREPTATGNTAVRHAGLQRLGDDREFRRKPPPAGIAGIDFHL
jgi:hypothetical protein